ncbi:Sodium- and chloride-dependent glycine transporter 2 [Holothuria leucospilota]|uniref:Sodium- and chloride-dependent glycine transporter 2 n=1 Tax=Holothuria leucospilota TaxID=206669 RepID=A0A9Q1HBL4_HOLLE|nr:Sodium- and chloride-dependent glycine transporter 2 [Holothuria leucospilota]
MSPSGVAVGAIIANWLTSITYEVVITYCLFYLVVSFTAYLPWSDCNNDWNTIYCATLGKKCLNQSSIIISNGSCYHPSKLTMAELEFYNVTESSTGVYDFTNYSDPLANDRVSSSEEYWTRKVRKEADSIGQTGGIVWELAFCLCTTNVIIFLSLFKGIKTSGKVVYFTATFPYVVLFALFCLGMTLPGHEEGISFFINPKWELLLEGTIWMDAAIQIFYSVGPAWGGIVTLSSYNKFHNNSCKDAIIVPLVNCLTSVFSGFVIFSIVGFMAYELNQPVESVVAEGYGLAFIAYPQAFNMLPVPALWSVLFFLMLTTLGLDSSFASMETTVTVILDEFPKIRKYKTYACGLVCTMSFLFGLLFVTEAGPYWANLIDQSAAGFQILMVGLVECSAISWIYGVRRLKNDIRSMTGNKWVDHPMFWYWIVTWTVLTPLTLGVILMVNWINWSDLTYNGPYPSWALAIGWSISAMTLVWIPVVLVYELIHAKGSLLQVKLFTQGMEQSETPIIFLSFCIVREMLSFLVSMIRETYAVMMACVCMCVCACVCVCVCVFVTLCLLTRYLKKGNSDSFQTLYIDAPY